MTSSVSLATATAGLFRSLLNESFRVTLPTGNEVTAMLAEVTERAAPGPGRRAPFSLVFHVPHDPAAPRPVQGTLILEHPTSGVLEVFAVPLQPQADIVPWQVVFG